VLPSSWPPGGALGSLACAPCPRRLPCALVEGRPVHAGGSPLPTCKLECEQVGRGVASASGHEETASAPPDPHHPISCCRYRVTRSTPRHRANTASYGSTLSPRVHIPSPSVSKRPSICKRQPHCIIHLHSLIRT
jgi:hypothetical protein